jgi:hypothetical protein
MRRPPTLAYSFEQRLHLLAQPRLAGLSTPWIVGKHLEDGHDQEVDDIQVPSVGHPVEKAESRPDKCWLVAKTHRLAEMHGEATKNFIRKVRFRTRSSSQHGAQLRGLGYH